MNVTYFNRHSSMDSQTREMILETIKELRFLDTPTHKIENYLFGAFDGYDYSEIAIFSKELARITHENVELGSKISSIFGIIEKYPRTEFPNHNSF